MAITVLRQSLSAKLINAATESALDRQAMQRSLAATSPRVRGQQEALEALRIAELFESAVLWLGWRLQPSQLDWVERHPV